MGSTSSSSPLALSSLMEMGMSRYEARAYLALMTRGSCTAKEVATVTGIPYGKVYEIINSLSSKGFTALHPTRPVRCRAVPPREAFLSVRAQTKRRLKNMERAVSQELEPLFSSKKNNPGAESSILVLNGREIVDKKINSLIIIARRYLNILISERGIKKLYAHKKDLQDAANRGVKVSVFISSSKKSLEEPALPGFCKIIRVDEDIQSYAFSNENQTLLLDPLESEKETYARNTGLLMTNTPLTRFVESVFSHYSKNPKCL